MSAILGTDEWTQTVRPLLMVGLAPSARLDASWPPLVGSRSGERIARMLDLSSSWDLSAVCDVRNLLEKPIPEGCTVTTGALREAAEPLMVRLEDYRVVVVLGVQVAKGLRRRMRPMTWSTDGRMLCWPHPSGRSRWWNDPQHAADARDLLREAFRRAYPEGAWR